MTLRRAILAVTAATLPLWPASSGAAADLAMDDWVEDGARSSKVIFVRNRSSQSIRITMYFLYDCENVAATCGTIRNAGKDVRPGEIVELAEVPAAGEGPAAFKYRYRVRPVP